jgi:hypothetical protein
MDLELVRKKGQAFWLLKDTTLTHDSFLCLTPFSKNQLNCYHFPHFQGSGYRRVASYKQHYLPDRSAHDLVIRAVDCDAVTASQVPAVLQEWHKPQHQEFLPRNGWSLFNAFTEVYEVYKTVNPQTAVKRGQALHGLFDTHVALAS